MIKKLRRKFIIRHVYLAPAIWPLLFHCKAKATFPFFHSSRINAATSQVVLVRPSPSGPFTSLDCFGVGSTLWSLPIPRLTCGKCVRPSSIEAGGFVAKDMCFGA